MMHKWLLLLILLLSSSFGSFIKKVEVYKASKQNMSIEEARQVGEFKRIQLPLIRNEKGDYFLKFSINQEAFVGENYIIEFFNEFNFIEIEKNLQILKMFRHISAEVQPNTVPKSFIVKVLNDEKYVLFDLKVYEKDDYIRQELIFNQLFGLAYGIIFTAFLYYLALFLFNREKTHIYYSLTQLSMLGMLFSFSFLDEKQEQIIMDIVFYCFFTFSNLFTQYFLNTKKHSPFMHKALVASLIYYCIDFILMVGFDSPILRDKVPISILLIIYLIAGVQAYRNNYKPALFYLMGWGVIIVSFVHVEAQFYLQNLPLIIKPIYLIHITAPLESLILAFALSYKMKMLEEQRNEQRDFVIHQSKLASMGEMLGNIAHQWRQPLTHLSYIMMNLKTAFEKERLSKDYFDKKSKEATAQLEYMSHTIDDFRNFFKVSKQKESFSLQEAVQEVQGLLHASLESKRIEFEFKCEKDITIQSYKGEFLQVLFNLINNAKDELIKKKIDNPKISIKLAHECFNKIVLEVSDNAQGVPSKLLKKIFEPYFTTKEQGLGLGLYMSKMIVEQNMQGKLTAHNTKEGACFTVTLRSCLKC